MSDLGLEDVERLVQEESKEKKNKHKKEKKSKRSYSRSRSNDRHKKKERKDKKKDSYKKHRSGSRDRSPNHKEMTSRDRDRHRTSRDKSDSRERQKKEKQRREKENYNSDRKYDSRDRPNTDKVPNSGPEIIDKSYFDKNDEHRKINEVKMIKDQLLEAQKLEEEARREDNTIIISSLPLTANERDIYKFFSKCGKIRDVYIIRDQRSGKSKGIAYVEFYYPDSILAACSTQNKDFNGQTIHIQPSHAEKNRVAQAARNLKQKALIPVPNMTNAATNAKRIYISNLTDSLADISENNLKNIFSPFGDIE